ncbi:MAG: DNA polymerase III subunit alpha [Acidimicrobiaceae bacterium]|nr:DNA polymerase III subunit alpha [Acidimicrobiaceae bacterium]MCY4279097.1 DNA polymerase III subunit alpha [Acidimicrobiaceae bacterium]
MPDSFVHLHTHTEYSILDGASRLDDLIAAAAADGQPALGITDHGNMYGVLDFYRKCSDHGIKPIIGMEAYMAQNSRYERPARRGTLDDAGGDTDSGKLYYHLTLLAVNDTGYKNLIKVASRAFLEGYYYKPRCDWETLGDHCEGLIATTGCLGGQVPQSLLRGNPEEALKKAARFQDIFGRDNYFVEMQDHGIPEQHQINPQLLEIARSLNAPLLATNDSHYTHRHDAEAHDALLCVQTGSLLTDKNRLKFHGDSHYLKSAAEMRHLFSDIPESCRNTLEIADRAEVNIEFGKPQLPHFEVPEDFSDDGEYLHHLTMEGARERWGDPVPQQVQDRLAYELEVINNMGFASYFLITWDLIAYARRRGIRVGPGRGSAAGCAVAYSLRITDLDPIRYDLLFERFLNPSRVSMPDIDMDFDSRHRDEVINYAADRYGRDHVAQIITFSTIKARAAVKDAARVLGHSPSLGDRIAKAMPPLILGRDTPLKYCFEDSETHHEGYLAAAELRQMHENDSDVAQVVDAARGLEGMRRQDSIHAAAVVITPQPLTEYMPIQRKPDSSKNVEDSPIVTQYEMHGVESLGLLKMDFLGLRNLDVISDTLELINRTREIEVDIDNVDLEDESTFEMLRKGDTSGVFQLENPSVRSLIQSLAPTKFDDICALVALYRPGPMAANMHNDYAERKNGRRPVRYFHPEAEEILADTYGLMIYQESVMRVAQRFAGYSLAEADNLRKAMGKKIREAMAAEEEKFVEGVAKSGYGRGLGSELFEIIAQFADYAFNKSHSYGYGYVAYQTAYLKANYPVEYLAALLTSNKRRLDSISVYLNDCRLRSIEVQVPDVNRSSSDFTPLPTLTGPPGGGSPPTPTAAAPPQPFERSGDRGRHGRDQIVYGLSAVRNVGQGVVERIVEEREANGPFESFNDFVERVDIDILNKRTVESLIKAGAFDSLGHPRQGLMQVYESIIDQTIRVRREHDAGVMSLFGEQSAGPSFDDRPEINDTEYGRMQKLAYEKEMLGLYVSDHPLRGMEARVRRQTDCTIGAMLSGADGGEKGFRRVGGVVTGLNRRVTRKGDPMASFVLEDLEDRVEVLVFPKAMAEHGSKLAGDAIVLVRGRYDPQQDAPRFIANDIEVLEALEGPAEDPPLRILLPLSHQNKRNLDELKSLLLAHPGSAAVELLLDGRRVARLPAGFAVDTSRGLPAELRELLGAAAIAGA